MKKICFIWILIGCLSLSVLGQKKRELSTPVSVSYMLPKISFKVEVTMERVKLIPGPFRQYAEQQLGIGPDINAAGEEWELKDIRIIPQALPDTKNIYSVTTTGEYAGICLNLTPEGFLSGVNGSQNSADAEKEVFYIVPKDNKEQKIDYVRFGVRSTLKEVLDSNFSMIEVEGEMRRVWDPIERYVLKEEKDYVKEITDEIFNIRKKRLDLLSGVSSSGPATREALKELDALEKDYLSLFMGKKVKERVKREFVYVPQKEDESVTLFRFSKTSGITAKNNVSAEPYVIEVKNVILPPKENDSAHKPVSGVTYRVPAVADLVLTCGNKSVITERCIIPQLGYTKIFPLDVINNEGISIDFYPRYGSLKSVKKNR